MVTITVMCRHCGSDRLEKDGFAPNGKRKYLCRACGKKSRQDPAGPRPTEERKAEILRAYQERQSMRGIARTFRISRNTLTEWVKGGGEASSP
jgi:transposase-like protein